MFGTRPARHRSTYVPAGLRLTPRGERVFTVAHGVVQWFTVAAIGAIIGLAYVSTEPVATVDVPRVATVHDTGDVTP